MLFLVSANHKTTEFSTLERLSAVDHATSAALVRAHGEVLGAVVLATCNRYEAYLDLAGDDEGARLPAVAAVVEEIARAVGATPREVRDASAFVHGTGVVRHLFAVASGLESAVIGEDEIAGQVRRALETAEHARAASPALSTLFQRATRASRTVKNNSGVGATGRSIVDVALDLAQSRIRDWREARVLLVGTGRYAAISAAALRRRGVGSLRVCSVSGGGGRFAERNGVPLIPPDALAREAADADLVIACTTSHRHVLDAAALAQGRQATRERPGLEATIIVDLGLPRNVDPDVKSLPGVTLIDLETIGSHASLERVDAIGEAVSLVWQATEQYASSARLRDLSPALAALRRHVLDLTDAEVQRALRRGGGAATEEALRHFAGVVLHRPMARARSLAEEGDAAAWIDGLAAVYGIEAEADAAAVALPDSSADLEERSA